MLSPTLATFPELLMNVNGSYLRCTDGTGWTGEMCDTCGSGWDEDDNCETAFNWDWMHDHGVNT